MGKRLRSLRPHQREVKAFFLACARAYHHGTIDGPPTHPWVVSIPHCVCAPQDEEEQEVAITKKMALQKAKEVKEVSPMSAANISITA